MFPFIQLGILVAALLVLAKSSQVAENSAVRISRITGLGQLAVGFIIIAVVTNLPELSIAVSSLISEKVNISLGNVFGANIADLLLVGGIISLIGIKKVTQKAFKELSMILFLTSTVSLLLLSRFYSPKLVGGILLLTFICFIYYSFKKRVTVDEIKKRGKKFKLSMIFTFLVALFFVIYSSRWVVSSASNFANFFGISEAIIGATIVSIGSTLPELSISLQAVRQKHFNLALGTIIGACLVTPTLVLGLVLLLNPVSVDFSAYSVIIGFFIISALITWIFIGRGKLELPEGILLLSLYILFLVSVFLFQFF